MISTFPMVCAAAEGLLFTGGSTPIHVPQSSALALLCDPTSVVPGHTVLQYRWRDSDRMAYGWRALSPGWKDALGRFYILSDPFIETWLTLSTAAYFLQHNNPTHRVAFDSFSAPACTYKFYTVYHWNGGPTDHRLGHRPVWP